MSLVVGGLLSAVNELPADVNREVIFCINGSRSEYVDLLSRLVSASDLARHGARVITSDEGKLAAQQAIVKARRLTGYLAFVDSDVVLDKTALAKLWQLLEKERECIVAYAQPVPIYPDRQNLIHRLTRVHYALREHAYQRAYFHGRAFMMREWCLDEPASVNASPALMRRLQLARGPLVDDIAISRMVVARWGAGAIREIQSANVYFDPPDDLRGLYASALRVALEIRRLDILYPHHSHLQKKLFARASRGAGLRKFSRRIRTAHALHRILDHSVKMLARVHAYLVAVGVLGVGTLWIRVPGTKSFARHRAAWRKFATVRSQSPQ